MTSKHPRMFYGWWMVFTGALSVCFGPPIVVFSFGVFFKSLVHDFQASRTAVSFAFALHNVVGALWLPVSGRLINRFGARRVILPSTIIYGLVLLSAISLGSSIWQFYLFYAALGFSTSGPSPAPYAVLISHWFNRRRGLALGVTMLGIGVGGLLVPLVAQRLIAMWGWHMAYAIFGGAVLLLPLPVATALLQNDPSERGLRPDGVEATQRSSEKSQDKPGRSWREIWHSPEFWLMVGAFCLVGASLTAVVVHLPALLTDRGLSAKRGAVASSVIGISVMLGRIGSGYLLDRFFAPRVAILFYSTSALGMATLWAGSAGNLALAAAFLIGLGTGAEIEVIGYLVSRYFGLRALAIAFGYTYGTFALSAALGPVLMGVGFDHTHSYTAPLTGFCIAMVLALVLLSRLGPYRYGVEAEATLSPDGARGPSGA